MKNVFKKACVLGSAALLAMGMSSSMVGAVPPTVASTGIEYGSVDIATGTLQWMPSLTLASGLRFNGSLQQLITALGNQVPEGATLYLRVADTQGAAPASSGDWVAYSSVESFASNALKRAQVGTYYVYWYLDGGTSGYEDIDQASDLQQP